MSLTAQASAPQAGVSIKEHLSIRHLRSAALLASQARRMEADITQTVEWSPAAQRRWDQCAALADACILTAVAGVEAAINELYIGAQSASSHDGLSDLLRAKLAALWPDGIKKRKGVSKILLKYESALDCVEAVNGSVVRPATDGVELLIETRNALTHAREEFRPAAPQGPATLWLPLEQKLRARVAPSLLTPPSAMYLWCRVLGAPLAEWAFVTAHEYASTAYAALGATNIFANERSWLT